MASSAEPQGGADAVREGIIGMICEAEFACHEGEPNWLGIVLILVGILAVIAFVRGVIGYMRR